MDILDNIQSRFEECKSSDNEKNQIIEDLISQVRSLSVSLEAQESQAQEHSILREHYLNSIRQQDVALNNPKHEIAKLSFVSLLIDGDCMNFEDALVKKGQEGDHEAVRLLRKATLEYLRRDKPDIPARIDLRIRVYANLKGLAKAYRDSAVISETADFESFVQGFNKEDALCDFIDAGLGKECSDTKLKAVFDQDVIDVHCCHLMFGASGDNGYARLLGPHVDSPKITLLEGPPFEREIQEVARRLSSTLFPCIFRTSKFPTRKELFLSTAPRMPVPDYAAAARTPLATPEPSIILAAQANRAQNGTTPRVPRNPLGQRIDSRLNASQQLVTWLKAQKLCNEYHLLGSCEYGNLCSHPHGPRRTGPELLALKQLARTRPCWEGPLCEDEGCIYGHCCPRVICQGQNCKFPSSLHGIDQTIVQTMVVR